MSFVRLVIALGALLSAVSSARADVIYQFSEETSNLGTLTGSFTVSQIANITGPSDIEAFSFTVTSSGTTETFTSSSASVDNGNSNFPIDVDSSSGQLLPNSSGGDPVLAIKSNSTLDELSLEILNAQDANGNQIVMWTDYVSSGETSNPNGTGVFSPLLPSSAVPEPTSFVLLASAAALIYVWRRRKLGIAAAT